MSGYANKNQPTKKATMAHRNGMCVCGTINIINPVLIPRGGMIIFRLVMGLFAAFIRIKIALSAIKIIPMVAAICKNEELIGTYRTSLLREIKFIFIISYLNENTLT